MYLAVPIRIYCRVFGSSRNGLFEGFFYIAVGAALGLKWDQLNRVPLLLEFAAVAFGLAGTYLVSNDAHLPFCAIASIGLFLLSVRRYGVNLNSCALAPYEHNYLPCAYVFRCRVCLRNLRTIKSGSVCE